MCADAILATQAFLDLSLSPKWFIVLERHTRREKQIERPAKTHLILITDLFEGAMQSPCWGGRPLSNKRV